MESSVPLMVTKYLVWRCQLYTAVCHCYFDLNLSLEAENFARRGLNKVTNLFPFVFVEKEALHLLLSFQTYSIFWKLS